MTRSQLLNAVRVVIGALVLVAVAVALQQNWDEVAPQLARLGWQPVLWSFVLALLAPVLTLVGWRVLLHDLGARLPWPAAASVFFVGQLGKYLPGSVWSVAIQADMGGRLGVSRRALGVVGLLNIALAVVTGAIVGVPAVPLLLSRTDAGQVSPWWLVVAGGLAVVLLWPRVLNWLISLGLKAIRRAPLHEDLGFGALAQTVVVFVGAWASMGAAVWVLAGEVAPTADPGALALATVCGFGLAGAIGMLSVVVPAGVGVRDGVLVLLLLGLLTPGAAAAVVLVHRFLSIVVDLVVAAGGFVWGRRHQLIGRVDA